MPIQSEELALSGPQGTTLAVRYLRPAGPEPLPAVLLLGAASDESLLEGAERVACAGFAVFKPEFDEPADRAALAALGLVLDALSRRAEVDPERVAVLGFGRGGTLAFLLGCTRRLAAVIPVPEREADDRDERDQRHPPRSSEGEQIARQRHAPTLAPIPARAYRPTRAR